MGRTGILHEDERVELLEGEIVCMAPIGSRHAACVLSLNMRLAAGVGERALVSVQSPLRLPPGSEPQPDLIVLRYREDFYAAGHPNPGDTLLVIEVADTTLRYDRGRKLPLYAAAGVPEVWIVDLRGKRVFVYRELEAGQYKQALVINQQGTLSPAVFPDLVIAAADVLR